MVSFQINISKNVVNQTVKHLSHLHLQMRNESLHSDFMFDLIEQTVAAEHHALQDSQRHLLDRRVLHLHIHKTSNLKTQTGTSKTVVYLDHMYDCTATVFHLCNEDTREILPRHNPMIHQLHEGS